jgi:heterodisulfide reductase subunit C
MEMVRRVARRLPFRLGMLMGLATLIRPRTRGWGGARAAITEYIEEQEAEQRRALGLGGKP